MPRTNARPFLKASELFLILMFLAVGFMVPVAYGNVVIPEKPAAPVTLQSTALNEADASCQMIRAAGRASECHVMDFNPSLDVILPGSRADTAKVFCEEVAESISANFKQLAGKTWKVRAFSSGLVPPTAVCRVR
jgi:hypothetical protein